MRKMISMLLALAMLACSGAAMAGSGFGAIGNTDLVSKPTEAPVQTEKPDLLQAVNSESKPEPTDKPFAGLQSITSKPSEQKPDAETETVTSQQGEDDEGKGELMPVTGDKSGLNEVGGLSPIGGGEAEPEPTEAEPEPTDVPEQEEPAQSSMDALKAVWLSPDQYYYAQLSDAHLAAWKVDIANALTYPDQTAALKQDRRYQALASMIRTDNPRIFWIDWIDSYGRLRYETGSTVHYEPIQLPEGVTLEQLKQTFLDAIPVAVAQIRAELPEDADTRDILRAIHDWVCENNTYCYAQTSSHKQESDPVSFAYQAAHSAYSGIVAGDEYDAVCGGYAGAFKILCDEFGIPCLCVNGSSSFSSAHMWNYVQLDDGQWYLVDTTSDDVEQGGIDYYHDFFLLDSKGSAKHEFTPREYMNSGINPSNNYTEGAAFTVPELAD